MHFDFVLLIIIFTYLRKNLQTKILLPELDKLLSAGLIISIVFLAMELIVKPTRNFTVWIAHAMLLYIIYVALTKKEFKPVKPFIYAILPIVVINLIEDVTKLISTSFYNEWNSYYSAANTCAVIWVIAMMFINKKQKKALEIERQKAIERGKELKMSETLKAALEVQVVERTAELLGQKAALEQTLEELKSTQSQLIQSEKMASLGELTAGIAHEIQNPLNFVNNFSEVSNELIEEMNMAMAAGNVEEAKALANDIQQNLEKILHHGKRADAIVKGMLQHSRSSSRQKEPTDINVLADEYLRLAYHGLRAKDKSFNAAMKTNFDDTMGTVNVIPQDIGRVILNLITNAFYAVNERKKMQPEGYEPTVSVSTKKENNKVLISVKDNGNGIPQKIIDKIFQPFFTTKPTGSGTGLGLSLSYDIVKAHGGEIKVESKEGEGTELVVMLPLV